VPNLPMHIYIAHNAAKELDWGYVHDHLGSCFLGSTAPDIRAMTKWNRERTHFAPLSLETVGTGTRRMFELYPELADHRNLSPATRSFVLGYISHLTADEVWITTMYRPHFSKENSLAESEIEAQIWDRALQLDMDRQAHLEMDAFTQAGNIICDGEQGVEVAFLEAEILGEWRQWVARFMGWNFDWERLKRALNRMYRDNDDVQQLVDSFLENMPDSLEGVYAQVPRDKLDAYRQEALNQTLAQVKEYLGEA
jgi:hypothetical protein